MMILHFASRNATARGTLIVAHPLECRRAGYAYGSAAT